MDGNKTDKTTPFSSPGTFCRFSLLFELLLPYVPVPLRQPLLLFSKLFECMKCMSCPQNHFSHIPYQPSTSPAEQLSDVLLRLSPFLSEAERQNISQMQNMMQMMSMYQTLQSMSGFFEQNSASETATGQSSTHESQDTASSDTSTAFSNDQPTSENASSGFDPAALLSALSPEQQQMFEMMQTMMNTN
ncbi:MAG: hypothetical protein IJY09_00225 [Lachnospiraceae bacterium]|nr:hypothetical protein [Lachnospiraceae bacterium]